MAAHSIKRGRGPGPGRDNRRSGRPNRSAWERGQDAAAGVGARPESSQNGRVAGAAATSWGKRGTHRYILAAAEM